MTQLITSAIPAELETLRAFVAKGREESNLVFGRIHQKPIILAPLGIGSVEAAITLIQILRSHSVDRVWFVGTCGGFENCPLAIGEAGRVHEVIAARAPGERLVSSDFDPVKLETSETESSLAIWSSTGVSEDAALINWALSFGVTAENLELWGVARACRRQQIPLDVFLGVSNVVGPDAHQQWKDNQKRAAAAACLLMANELKDRG